MSNDQNVQAQKPKPDTFVVVPGRMSYLNVFEAKSIQPGQPARFSASIIIPKSDTKTIEAVRKAIQAAFQAGIQKTFGGKTPLKWDNPLRDGDDPTNERSTDPAYKNSYYINAKSPASQRPEILDQNFKPILDPSIFYSGCRGRASINFYPYAKVGNVGVGAGLGNLQKLGEGDPLTNRSTAADDFAGLPIDDPNEL